MHFQKSRIGLAQLESTFDTIVEAFVFFDRDHDGFITKDEFVGAINEAAPGKEGAEIGVQRFGKHFVYMMYFYKYIYFYTINKLRN